MDNFFSQFVLSEKPLFRFGRHFLFWTMWWLFLGFIYGFLYSHSQISNRFSASCLDSLLYLPQHILLSYAIIYFVLPHFILLNKYWAGFGLTLLFILLAALMSPVIQNFLITPFHMVLGLPPKRNAFLFSLMGGLRGSMTVAGFAVAIKLIKHWYFKKMENEALEKEKLKAELAVLRGQMHPHFIFNTLNGIYSLALKKSEQTAEAIVKLSDMMRYMFSDCNSMTIALSKEIEILNNYLALARMRYRDRVDMTVNIAGDFDNKRIAPLLILPFLENSFKYGAHEMLSNAWISLDLIVKGDVLKFKLINGKSPEKEPGTISSGIGISNVEKRLRMMYPDAHDLRLSEDDDTFIVLLTLQLEKIKTPTSDEEVELSFS